MTPAEHTLGRRGHPASCSPPADLLLLKAVDALSAAGSPPTSPSHSAQPSALGGDSERTMPVTSEREDILGGNEEENWQNGILHEYHSTITNQWISLCMSRGDD